MGQKILPTAEKLIVHWFSSVLVKTMMFSSMMVLKNENVARSIAERLLI